MEATKDQDLEIRLAMTSEGEMAYLRSYLEQVKHCRITYMSAGYYLIRFPSGTTEKPCTDPDPQAKEETQITLPDGTTLKKFVHWPCIRPGCSHVRLILPVEKKEIRRMVNDPNHRGSDDNG